MERSKGYYNTFVVKIWRDEAEGTMRGYIQHVSTQEYAHFLSLENMTDFIVSHLGPPLRDSIAQGRTQDDISLLIESIGDSNNRERMFPE